MYDGIPGDRSPLFLEREYRDLNTLAADELALGFLAANPERSTVKGFRG